MERQREEEEVSVATCAAAPFTLGSLASLRSAPLDHLSHGYVPPKLMLMPSSRSIELLNGQQRRPNQHRRKA